MRKKRRIIRIVCLLLLLTACEKEPEGSEQVNDILKKQGYIEVSMGEAYHQERVLFDSSDKKAVVPKDAGWGFPEFREGADAGVFYGPGEGGELYETDAETTPELYLGSYLESIQNLDLTAADVKNAKYVIKVAKRAELRPFAVELLKLSNIVMKDNYRLTGVEIVFDKECRPIKKVFQLQELDGNALKTEEEGVKCVQEFSYKIGKMKFERALKKVKKEIEEE